MRGIAGKKEIDPLSLLGQLMRPITPSKFDIAREKALEKERERKKTETEKAKTRNRMRKLRSKT